MTVAKVIIMLDDNGFVRVLADAPIEAFTVDLGLNADRVYRLTAGRGLQIDPAQVAAVLAGETVGHADDGREEDLLATGRRVRTS